MLPVSALIMPSKSLAGQQDVDEASRSQNQADGRVSSIYIECYCREVGEAPPPYEAASRAGLTRRYM
jgi:hypothetical protein